MIRRALAWLDRRIDARIEATAGRYRERGLPLPWWLRWWLRVGDDL